VDRIEVTAAAGDHHNGSYTWAAMGAEALPRQLSRRVDESNFLPGWKEEKFKQLHAEFLDYVGKAMPNTLDAAKECDSLMGISKHPCGKQYLSDFTWRGVWDLKDATALYRTLGYFEDNLPKVVARGRHPVEHVMGLMEWTQLRAEQLFIRLTPSLSTYVAKDPSLRVLTGNEAAIGKMIGVAREGDHAYALLRHQREVIASPVDRVALRNMVTGRDYEKSEGSTLALVKSASTRLNFDLSL
jgi:hypothetical protein